MITKEFRCSYSRHNYTCDNIYVCKTKLNKLCGKPNSDKIKIDISSRNFPGAKPFQLVLGKKTGKLRYSFDLNLKRPRGIFFSGAQYALLANFNFIPGKKKILYVRVRES